METILNISQLSLRVAIARVGEPGPDEIRLAANPLDSSEAIYDFWNGTIARRPDYEPDKEHLYRSGKSDWGSGKYWRRFSLRRRHVVSAGN